MKISISKMQHPQSGKLVDSITVLGQEFALNDSRGHTTYAMISKQLALDIISNFEAKKLDNGKELFNAHNLVNTEFKLNWYVNMYSRTITLTLHGINHIWSSSIINF